MKAVPVGQGAMAAIMGLNRDAIERICGEVTDGGGRVVAPANLNAPGQTVVSGHAAAVEKAIALCEQRGARRAVKLQVSAPFHCPLMGPAASRLAADLDRIRFNDLDVPLVTNVNAKPVRAGEEARRALVEQVTAPVNWEGGVRTLAAMGVDRALEVGPGRVLAGLIKRIEPGIACAPAGDVAAIRSAKEFLS